MPELPEVEVVRRGVAQWAAGRRVEQVHVHDDRSLRRFAEGPAEFSRRLTGLVLGAPQRRGKFLWVPLESAGEPLAVALVVHLGMSGQVLIEQREAPEERHLKITLDLGNTADDAVILGSVGEIAWLPGQLRFVDQRIFGGMQLSPLVPDAVVPESGRLIPEIAAHIAPDPLEPVVTGEWLFQVLRRRRTGLKRALLDQTAISGVGNIYADEALWRARMHYARRTETVTRAQAGLLLTALREVMEAALAAGGTSFDALYVNVNGASGYFDRSLAVYGRAGRQCSRCAGLQESGELAARRSVGAIRLEKFMNRSSYFCPVCQPRPRNGRW
ncbi:bifunctional DNA-formamidopyrimidine glycosylase/DNA-(apurinic or apyrimidinic site) lyase [Nesterenkonia ebinurensis]|uniref:bifunctional DNA-formamidopyrimidine glycosylase/DNA-(apurinic or apyrimidinic site) lyase n=1 Tax=Nesterenkonia ebinurensis TaxID=2608252 RepID=UPI00123E16F4|nr:bifunctional DNA-formamidopyrimidine glycosylase/DNA-(apurinic or apyrimidinic site) lyase [Nesterenkonia ebinurensis]